MSLLFRRGKRSILSCRKKTEHNALIAAAISAIPRRTAFFYKEKNPKTSRKRNCARKRLFAAGSGRSIPKITQNYHRATPCTRWPTLTIGSTENSSGDLGPFGELAHFANCAKHNCAPNANPTCDNALCQRAGRPRLRTMLFFHRRKKRFSHPSPTSSLSRC